MKQDHTVSTDRRRLSSIAAAAAGGKKIKYNIVYQIPRDDHTTSNAHNRPTFFLEHFPLPLRIVLCVCVVNFLWLVFFSSHHLESANQHELIALGDNNNNNNGMSRSLRITTTTTSSSATSLWSSWTTVDTVLVVIVSNRLEGILPTVSSILAHTTSKPVDLVLIGDPAINEQVRQHFAKPRDAARGLGTIHAFTSLTVRDVQDDLLQQGYQPIWTWPEWGSSRHPHWRNQNTLHVADWDELETHAHELNHLRFYLPLVSLFRDRSNFYFLDDDILVRKDLGHAADQTMANLAPERGLVTPCNIWIWNNDCHHFGFQNEETIKSILEMPSLYGDRHVCQSEAESHCYPASYKGFLESVLPRSNSTTNRPQDQKAWNFGFSLFALDHWRQLGLTQKYEAVMKESYRQHVFPETSLTFGLGVAYLAFAGAVECWKDDQMSVRDGFGFIEWNRYEHTFGKGFFDKIDVLHYTGPHKPWVANTTIEARVLDPWLHHMQQENMALPDQLPTAPTQKLFTLLASDRTGAQWIMNTLDTHPSVCATGEGDKPESGFPTEALLPSGVTWEPVCSVKRGCTLQFIHDHVVELVDTMDLRSRTGLVPARCRSDYDGTAADPLGPHLPRICNFVNALQRNFTDANIERVWFEAFRDENQDLMSCTCKRGTQIKGVKVLGEWLTYKNFPFHKTGEADMSLSETALTGSKVIRLKRRNQWAQYKSLRMAQESAVYHMNSAGEKLNQLSRAGNVTIDIEDMLTTMYRMNATDEHSDQWAEQHGSEVLYVDYEDCRADTKACFERIFGFLEVDTSFVAQEKNHFESNFASFNIMDSSLNNIVNKGAVQEALAVNGWGDSVELPEDYHEVQLLIYDESESLDKTHQFHQEKGINATVFGQSNGNGKYKSKFAAAVPLLDDLDPNTLVVLSDNWDARIRFPAGSDFLRYQAIDEFRSAFKEITRNHPGAVVASTESHCCASALTHVNPGDYFADDGRRKQRACQSGKPGCEWAGDENAWPWQSFMQQLAKKRSPMPTEDQYLDASLIAGKAGHLLRLIAAVNISNDEDDRAVLTDYMYLDPDAIILDYGQRIFGKNREGLHSQTNRNCPFAPETSVATARQLEQQDSKQVYPSLFVHTPRDLGCISNKNYEEHPVFPRWSDDGIQIKPILDHLDRVASENATIIYPHEYGDKPNYSQGPEIPYFVEGTSISSSKLIRDKTDAPTMEWRAEPTEKLMRMAHRILMAGGGETEARWSTLLSAIRSGGFPYWAWYGDFKTCNFHNYKNFSIPLFTPAVQASCTHAFPVPTYMNILDSQKNSDHWRGLFRDTKLDFPWENKIRKVVWRGSLSEATWSKALTSVRWRANVMIHNLHSENFDVGLTSIPKWISDFVDVDTSLVGGLVENISPMANFQNYLAVMDMDGNSWSSRFASLLCYNSVIIKVEPQYVEYFYSDLKPWTHYIPVKDDLSDLEENVAWALDPTNEGTVKDIITSANEWCAQRLIPDELAKDLLDIWQAYVRLLDRADPKWQKLWLEKRKQIVSKTSDLDVFQLSE